MDNIVNIYPQTQFKKVPYDLQILQQWVVYDLRDERKRPTSCLTGYWCSVTDSSAFGTFKQARRFCELHKQFGLGFVFHQDPYTGIDVDGKEEHHLEIVNMCRILGAYVEESPSGRGYHIIGTSKQLPRGRKDGQIKMEMYSNKRYFTVTGRKAEGDVNVNIDAVVDKLKKILEEEKTTDEENYAPDNLVNEIKEVLSSFGMVKDYRGDKLDIICPWTMYELYYQGETPPSRDPNELTGGYHSNVADDTGTVLMENGFDCKHAHCQKRTLNDLVKWAELHSPGIQKRAREHMIEPLPSQALEEIKKTEVIKKTEYDSLFISGSQMRTKLKPINWLVKDYLEEDAIGVMFGPPSVYKSFISIDLAMSVASGLAWHGHKVKKGNVFYIAGEGHNGLARRQEAWLKTKDIKSENCSIYFSQRPFTFWKADPNETANECRELINHMIKLTHEKPALIVIDTLARNFGGGNENATEHMGQFINNMTVLRYHSNATILIVHHTSKQNEQQARGSGALKGGVDFEYRVERLKPENARQVCLHCPKLKEAPEPQPLYFEGVIKNIGIVDEEGKYVTSLTMQPVSGDFALSTKELRQVHVLVAYVDADNDAQRKELAAANGISKASFYRIRTQLIGDSLLTEEGEITENGFKLIDRANKSTNSHKEMLTE